jgi:hypothetical protein
MGKIDTIYKEYVRLIERHDKLLDGSFEDFRLYAIIGSLFTIIIGFINTDLFNESFLNNGKESIDDFTFLISLFTFLLVALIAARDLLKQTYITHLTYNIRKLEKYIQDSLLTEEDRSRYEIFNLRRSWLEKYFNVLQKSYSFFLLIFFSLIALIPVTVFFLGYIQYGIILSVIILITIVFYSVLIRFIYLRTYKEEA